MVNIRKKTNKNLSQKRYIRGGGKCLTNKNFNNSFKATRIILGKSAYCLIYKPNQIIFDLTIFDPSIKKTFGMVKMFLTSTFNSLFKLGQGEKIILKDIIEKITPDNVQQFKLVVNVGTDSKLTLVVLQNSAPVQFISSNATLNDFIKYFSSGGMFCTTFDKIEVLDQNVNNVPATDVPATAVPNAAETATAVPNAAETATAVPNAAETATADPNAAKTATAKGGSRQSRRYRKRKHCTRRHR